MVFVGVQRNAMVGQGAAHLRVARLRLRLVVVVGKYGLHTQLLRQFGHFFFGLAVAHDQACGFVAGQLAQLRVQIDQRFANELHPPVGPGQGVQDVGIKDKHRVHFDAVFQRMKQRGVV